MKPVAIFRHLSIEGPGYFATFLDNKNIPWELIKVDAGDVVPADPGRYSGLVFMGGPMSVNDDLPWVSRSLELIRQAAQKGIPVLGHCLGGQLMAKALGGEVGRNPIKEIGWGEVTVANTVAAAVWFGETRKFGAFHWHGETFSLPPGAERVLSSAHCVNQAFVLDGKHLAMQCHVEMTEAMVREWYVVGAGEVAAASSSPAVQSAAMAEVDLAQRVAALNAVSEKLYSKWIGGLAA
ncbi:MAG: type 1 glutamine amidotransferase [Sulfuricella sp.]|nr:type 1 glutamine amidotransferase [Sulfuricella sp.]